jgi:hypothetical protein
MDAKGKVVKLDHLFGKVKNRVARVGVEIEGAWEQKKNRKFPQPGLVRDGSVFKSKGDPGPGAYGLTRNDMPGFLVGELSLGPMVPIGLKRVLRKWWPDQFDESCGLHLHMSFETTLRYITLANKPDYQETICHYLGGWATEEGISKDHSIWARLKGESVYCQKKFWPSEQMFCPRKDHDQVRKGHRYTVVNYSWQRFKTVEVRVLPMMINPDVSYRALNRIIDVTNAYLLRAEKTRKLKVDGKLELDNGDIYEETIEVLL